jgi:hypothetical protein
MRLSKASKERIAQIDLALDANGKRHNDLWDRDEPGLSMWANSLNSNLLCAEKSLIEHGNKAEFRALFTHELKNGKLVRVRAKLLHLPDKFCPWKGTRAVWMVQPKDGGPVTWVNDNDRAAKRAGFVRGFEKAPAKACYKGRGHGLSGQCWVSVERTDDGFGV